MQSCYHGIGEENNKKEKRKHLAEILSPLVKTWKIYSTKAIISEKHWAAPEGKWFPSRGIEIPCNCELFGPKKSMKIFVREKIKNRMFITLILFEFFFHLNRLWPNELICGADILTIVIFFFLSGFSFTNIHDSQDNEGRGRVSI